MNKSQLWLWRFDIPTSHTDCFVILPLKRLSLAPSERRKEPSIASLSPNVYGVQQLPKVVTHTAPDLDGNLLMSSARDAPS